MPAARWLREASRQHGLAQDGLAQAWRQALRAAMRVVLQQAAPLQQRPGAWRPRDRPEVSRQSREPAVAEPRWEQPGAAEERFCAEPAAARLQWKAECAPDARLLELPLLERPAVSQPAALPRKSRAQEPRTRKA
jgi:hypothetical protein